MNMLRLSILVLLAGILVTGWLLVFGTDQSGGEIDGPTILDGAGADPAEVDAKEAGVPTAPVTPQAERKANPVETELADEHPSYLAALGGLKGRLVWKETRKPLADVEVVCLEAWGETVAPSLDDLMGLGGAREPWIKKGKGRSDSEGRFEIRGVHGRALLFLAIGLRSDVAAIRFVDRTPGKGELVDLGDIEILERGKVEGQVVDSDGKGIAGARVRVLDIPSIALKFGLTRFDAEGLMLIATKGGRPDTVLPLPSWVRERDLDLPFGDARTSADGHFVVSGVRPGQATVLVAKERWFPLTRQTRVKSGETRQLGKLTLKAGRKIEGRVLDSQRSPVSGVRISAGSMLNMAPIAFLPKPIETDAEGRFALEGLGRAKHWIAMRRDSTSPWEIHGPCHVGEELTIVLPSLIDATLRVQNQAAKPLDEVRFAIGAADEIHNMPGLERRLDPAKHLEKDSKSPGTWKLRSLPEGKYRVTAQAEGHAIGVGVLELVRSRAPPPLLITLLPAHETSFVVTDKKKRQPVAGARIYWNARRSKVSLHGKGSRERRLSEIPVLLGRTDERGVLETRRVPEGATRFHARHPAYAVEASEQQAARRGVPIRFELQEGGHVEGRLTEGGAQPKELRTVMAEPRGRRLDGWVLPRFTVSGPDGKFAFHHLDPGSWKIQVVPDFGKLGSVNDFMSLGMGQMFMMDLPDARVTIQEGLTSRVDLELVRVPEQEGSGSISGVVTLNGKPARGVHVSTWSRRRRIAKVDAAGHFSMDGLKDGYYYLQFRSGKTEVFGMNTLWGGGVQIKDGAHVPLNLDLFSRGLEILVLDPAGHPLPGVGLGLRGQQNSTDGKIGGSSHHRAVTDADGVAVFEDVLHGKFAVRTQGGRDRQFVMPATEILVDSSSPRRVKLRAIPAIKIGGRVRYEVEGLSADEVAHVRKKLPRWISFQAKGRQEWTRIDQKPEGNSFTVHGLAPGAYEVAAWGGTIGWSRKEALEVTGPRTGLRIVLVPAKGALDKFRKEQEAKKAKGKKGSSRK